MWVNLLQRLAEAILFFNPAVWYLKPPHLDRSRVLLRRSDVPYAGRGSGAIQDGIALALLRVVELARGPEARAATDANGADDLLALAAAGRRRQLRTRIEALYGETLYGETLHGEPVRERLRFVEPAGG